MELSTRYSPEETEAKWYKHWLERKYFRSVPDEREPFTIVIPPPNVTGVLHMGHMLNNTIQDILIRKARLDGKNACWVPGTDHASIATEAKVVKMLREKGIKKGDIGREEFLKYAFAWKEEYGGIILDQLKRLGASCDWDRTRFTMEPRLSAAVMKVFVDLYRKGRIYRQLRMTNWDPEAQTVLSNEEVIYFEENAQLFYLRYEAADGSGEGVIIATQRPETIMADVAVAVHPADERYAGLIGKEVLIPLIRRPIPVIADEYVDREFGTGALKITPAHDQNDYEIGKRHQLEVIDIFHADGRLNEKAQILVGEDRFAARKKIRRLLEDAGNLLKLEDYITKIGRSERTHAVVEPRLTLQWFVDMREMSRMALRAVESGQVTFWPGQFWNMYYNWLREENVRDWCISRQLWWGHRIPAWYHGDHIFVAETAEEALQQAREKTGNTTLQMDDLQQDEDVLDTWFSSWLWPISVFDGFESQEELRYYYPTSVLVTGWDIIYLWVARMIMSGYEWSGELLGLDHVLAHGREPFKDVYFTGMVRDNKRRKMSKQLGNSPEALQLLERYGADGVRFGMMSSGAAGNDIIFDAPFDPQTSQILNESKLCEQGRNFCNKMWNALRLIRGWEQAGEPQSETARAINELAGRWMTNKLAALISRLDELFAEYRLSEALMDLYKFIWDDFCSWYLEMIKPDYGRPIDRQTYQQTVAVFEKLMTLLHPFMPFVTEEIWYHLRERRPGEDCIVSRWPASGDFDGGLIAQVERAKEAVTSIRDIRNGKGIKMKDELALFVQEGSLARQWLSVQGWREMVTKMANLSTLEVGTAGADNSVSFLVDTETFFVVLQEQIDTAAECARLKEELAYCRGFLKQVNNKLSNERFVSSAPAEVVEKELKKKADGEARLKSIEESLSHLGCEA